MDEQADNPVPKRRWLIAVGLVVSALVAIGSAYSAAFFGWATATPLDDSTKDLASQRFDVWAIVFIASLAAMVWLLVLMVRGVRGGN